MERKERFRRSLELKEVDKLPHGEQMIHDKLIAAMLHQPLDDDSRNALVKWMKETLPEDNFRRHVKVREMLNFDWVHLFPIEPITEAEERDGKIVARDIWKQVLHITDESFEIREWPITEPKLLDSYQFPSPEDFIYSDITRWAGETDFWVTVQIDTGLFKASQLVGFEKYMHILYDYPDKLHGFMERFTEFQKGLIDRILEAGADSIWFSDDHAFNAGPFIAPESLWEYDFRYLKELVEYVHSRGKYANYHSCGLMERSIPLLLEAGIDSLHAIQPSAGNDMYAYKREYGKDLCFIGNFDMDRLMPKGSPEEIDKKVKEAVENMWAEDRTGYILSTCNMLNNDQPVENALMLHMAAEKYGK